MANHVEIQSAASLFTPNIHIIDVMGVSTMFCYLPSIFFGAGLGEKPPPPPFSRRVLPLTGSLDPSQMFIAIFAFI